MTIDTRKSDLTLKMQFIRMQFEVIAYGRIKRGLSDRSIVENLSKLWLDICTENEIIPVNNFVDEFTHFDEETILKFAPEATLINMEEKSFLNLEKNGISRERVKKVI